MDSICRVLYFKSNAAAGLTGGNPVHGLEVGDPWLENPHCLLLTTASVLQLFMNPISFSENIP